MLRITIELVPFGLEGEKKTLSVVEVINDGTGNAERSNYIVRKRVNPKDTEVLSARVKRFYRSRGWLPLLKESFAALEIVREQKRKKEEAKRS